MKFCGKCKTEKLEADFGKDARRNDGLHIWCRECVNSYYAMKRKGNKEYSKYQMEYRKSTPEREEKWKESRRNSHMKSSYGISLDEWREKKASQDHKCTICLNTFASTKETHVDHNHTTGQVRDLICNTCNLLIGYARESESILQAAAEYLQRHNRKAN